MIINNNISKEKKQYKQITAAERYTIDKLLKENFSIRKIAKLLNRAPSSISREIKRNKVQLLHSQLYYYDDYIHDTAQIITKDRRKKAKPDLLEKYDANFFDELYKEMTKKYRIYSVESFIVYYKAKYPDKRVPSTKTVYRLIHKGKLKLKLYQLPRMSKLKPRKNKNTQPKVNKTKLGTSIEERPDVINNREEEGHFEIDIIHGKKGKDEPVGMTLVDRVTRFGHLIYIEKLNADNVNKELIKLFRKFGKRNFKSITADNGSEFSKLHLLESKNFKVYFTHPYSSYERGTNENTNGLIREFLPKGKSMKGKKKEFEKIEKCLNSRPRKILGFRRPIDLHNEYLKLNNSLLKKTI